MQTEPNCRILEHPQSCSVWDPTKIFLTWTISYLVFCNTKTGTANRWDITYSKPLGPIIMIGQSETGSGS
jgi:hypothetical protein